MKFMSTLIGFLALISTVNGQGVGAIRLIRNGLHSTTQAYSSGIVEIYYGGKWGNICDDSSFGYNEANVICYQLAFTGVSSFGSAGSTTIYGEDSAPTVLEDIDCPSGSYLVLLQCYHSYVYTSYCNKDIHDAFVDCYTTKIWDSNPYSGQLRLMNGTYSNQGHLEVYCNEQWKTVCHDSFGASYANVACKQLGYSGYSRYNYISVYAGSTSLPIWLDSVHCLSSDTCLVDCERCSLFPYSNYNHSKDVSLECKFNLSPASGPHVTLTTCNNTNSDTGRDSILQDVGIAFGIIFGLFGLLVVCICCAYCYAKHKAQAPKQRLVVYEWEYQ